MSKPIILFVGDDQSIKNVRLPDDSILVGYNQRPLDRVPEFVIGPNGDTVHHIWKEDYLVGHVCPQCGDKREQEGFIFFPDGVSKFIGVFQCGNCGLFSFPQWLRTPPIEAFKDLK